jgi:intein/homing endonuclease
LSGYIQKKIVNAINDFKVRHDGTVRDANGSIVQFAYGGEGFSAKELMPCGGLPFPFFINPVVIAGCMNSEAEQLRDAEEVDIGELRVLTQDETNLLVSFVEYLCAGKKTEVAERITFNIRTALRAIVKKVKIYEYMIPHFCRKIKDEFEEARAKNGYMAGLTAASSIGEPTTQMSQSREDKIPLMIRYLDSEKTVYWGGEIGEIIDSILESDCGMIFHQEKSEVGIPFPDVEIYVHTVNQDTSKTAWKKVQEVSKHPANGGMIKIGTKSGRYVTTTLSHSHLSRSSTGVIVPVRGDQLKLGDFVPVCAKMEIVESINNLELEGKMYHLDDTVGWLFGAYLSEGNVTSGQIHITNITSEFEKRCNVFASEYKGKVKKVTSYHPINGSKKSYPGVTHCISGCTELGRYLVEVCGHGSKNKHVPAFALFAPEEFVKGLIRGYFDGDGNVNADRQLIMFHSISRDLIETMALLLNRFGIFGTIGVEKKESLNPLYSYRILRKHASIYLEQIGSDHPDKVKGLEEIVAYNNREDVHSQREDIDVIPGVGQNISAVAKPLKLPGFSRTYKRYEKKPYVGRETLKKYIKTFEEKSAAGPDFEILKIAAESDIIWDQITSLEILEDPDEFVYDLGVSGNHTFMLQSGIFTHNTLNSVDGETLISVRFNNNVIQPIFLGQIGRFIDDIINSSSIVFHYENETEYVDVKHLDASVTCVDENGRMHWKRLEAVTKHLPGGDLVEIKTRSGRSVKVTKSKSLLVRENNKIVPKLGSEIKKGDRVPIVMNSPVVEDPLEKLDVSLYLPKTAYIYGSEMRKMQDYKNSGIHSWWAKGKNTKFTVPYARGDAASEGLQKCYLDGCVYPKQSGHVISKFPEMIPLDQLTGFLFGAYLAEGCVTDMYTSIANNDEDYLYKIKQWCDRYSIGYHVTIQHDKNFVGATSTDIRIHSNLLAHILEQSCGKGSALKHIPPWSLVTKLEFVSGLLDGYFSGDGTVNKRDKYIVCSSASSELLDGISELCTRFGIFGSRSVHYVKSNNVGSKIILPVHTFSVRNGFAKIFAENISLTIKEKQDILDIIKVTTYQRRGGRFDIIPGINIGEIQGDVHRDDLRRMLHDVVDQKIRTALEDTINSDVFFDEVISVTEVVSTSPKVYDLTVEDTRNFTIFGGLCVRDTFHNAGNSAKDVTLGVPRLKELINATKKPSKPTCTVYLDEKALHDNLDQRTKAQADLKKAEDTKDDKRIEEIKLQIASIDKDALYLTTGFSAPLTYLSVGYFVIDHELRYLSVEGARREDSPIGLLTYEEYAPEWWVTLSYDLGNVPKFDPQAWVIILHLDLTKLYRFGISVGDVARRIEENAFGTRGYAMACVPSPDVVGQIEVYLNFTEIGEYARSEIELPHGETITRHLITPDNVEYFVTRDVALEMIKKTEVQGVLGIQKTYVRQEYKTGEWIVDTQGTNLMKLLGLPGIDQTRTLSDDMWEIYRVLGIEATRKFLYREMNKILSFDGAYINPRHIYLLVDGMTRSGTITSVNRDGIPRDVGPIAKGMFEKAVDNFGEAAAFAEHDKMKGVAAAVMFGTLAEVGSGTVEIKDAEKLPAKRKPMEIPLKPGTKKVKK